MNCSRHLTDAQTLAPLASLTMLLTCQ